MSKFYSRYWSKRKNNFFRNKSRGINVHYSGFITPHGVVQYEDHAWDKIKDTEEMQKEIEMKGEYLARLGGSLMITGEKNDGYYKAVKFVEDCKRSVKICKANYGDRYQRYALYLDNARLHKTLAKDSLNVENLNLTIGGKQGKLRDGWYYM